MERWWKVPLAGEGRKPRLHRRHRVYKLVEDTKHRPKENLELILTQSVEGKARAQVLQSQAGSAWHQLFPALSPQLFVAFSYLVGEKHSSTFEKRKP